MRRMFTWIIIVFLSGCLILVCFFDKNTVNHISILTIFDSKQRNITDGEEISFTFFINDTASFLLDKDLVNSVYLTSETNQLELDLVEIRSLDYTETYQYMTYHGYCFDLSFESLDIDSGSLSFKDALLQLTYENGDEISLEIGNVYLSFHDLVNPEHMDMQRMFGLYNHDPVDYINGLVIEIDNLIEEQLSITDISIGNDTVQLDLAHTVIETTLPGYTAKLDDLLGYSYHSFNDSNSSGTIELVKSSILIVPIQYTESLCNLSRFPIKITYEYRDQTYIYMIDDFQFNSKSYRLEDNSGNIRKFTYHY